MDSVAGYAGLIAFGYLYGAIPWGLIIGRLTRQIDVREHGSGNIGFANVQRLIGLPLGTLVLAGDVSKGALPTVLARLAGDDPWLEVAGASAGMIGHCWPVYLRFRGGKGVATGLGATAVIAPLPLIAVSLAGALFLATTRYVSLTVLVFAPIMGGLMLVLALLDQTSPAYASFVWLATAIIFLRHRENIRRLRAGTEAKLGQPLQRAAS